MTKDEALKLALDVFERMNHKDSIFYGDFDREVVAIKVALEVPQRPWVGLTEAQCGVLWKVDMTPFDYYKAIEAKLKEMNT